jgi:hypothetical protein
LNEAKESSSNELGRWEAKSIESGLGVAGKGNVIYTLINHFGKS